MGKLSALKNTVIETCHFNKTSTSSHMTAILLIMAAFLSLLFTIISLQGFAGFR